MSASITQRRARLPKALSLSAILAACLAFATGAPAQTYPSKPIHIVVPYAAGGITDVVARALGQRLTEAWKQQEVIETRPGGAAGQIGAEYAARSPADGYTLLVSADATFVTNQHVYGK